MENESENETWYESEDRPLQWVQGNTVGSSRTINQKTPQGSRKKKRINGSQKSNGSIQKSIYVLNQQEDQYNVFGTYIASELRLFSSEYLRQLEVEKKISTCHIGLMPELTLTRFSEFIFWPYRFI